MLSVVTIASMFIDGHRREIVIRNRSVWSTLFLLNVLAALKELIFYFKKS